MLTAFFFFHSVSQLSDRMLPTINGINQDINYIDIECLPIDQYPDMASNFGLDFRHMPCLLIMNDSSEIIARISGYQTRDRLLSIIKTLRK